MGILLECRPCQDPAFSSRWKPGHPDANRVPWLSPLICLVPVLANSFPGKKNRFQGILSSNYRVNFGDQKQILTPSWLNHTAIAPLR
jgi:hypothetical protein